MSNPTPEPKIRVDAKDIRNLHSHDFAENAAWQHDIVETLEHYERAALAPASVTPQDIREVIVKALDDSAHLSRWDKRIDALVVAVRSLIPFQPKAASPTQNAANAKPAEHGIATTTTEDDPVQHEIEVAKLHVAAAIVTAAHGGKWEQKPESVAAAEAYIVRVFSSEKQ